MHTVLLVNKDLRGQQIQPVSGKSGKLYGNATYNPMFSCPVFSMSLEDYEKCADDVMGNAFAGQQWIPVFKIEEPQPAKQPEVEHVSRIIAEAGLGLGTVTGTLSEQVQHLCTYIKDAQLRGAPRIGDDFAETPQPAAESEEQPIRRLLAMFTINELRALAKKLGVDWHGTRDDLMTTISEKVSTE